MSVLEGPRAGELIAPDGTALTSPARSTRSARRLMRQPWPLVVGGTILGVIVVVLVLTPWLAPYDPTEQDLLNRLSAPTAAHWLGTDQLGRDQLSRLMYGGRFS